jgi:hypothetical protein
MAALLSPSLLERRAELPSLRHLHFGAGPFSYDPVPDSLITLLSSPAFDDLETLTLDGNLTQDRADVLISRAASSSLRRIGASYAQSHVRSASLRQLVLAPNLAGVTHWDLRSGEREHGEWDSAEARSWGAVRAKRAPSAMLLDADVVDLIALDPVALHEALCDGAQLRPSARLKALRLASPDDALLTLIAAQGAQAWPALEALIFQRTVTSEELVRSFSASALLDQLLFLSWPDHAHPDDHLFSRTSYDKDAAQVVRMAHLDAMLSGQLHPFFAFRLWCRIRRTLTRKPDRLAISRRLGVSVKLPDDFQFLEACEHQLIELLGRRAVLNWGPPSACFPGYTQPLQWPDPVYMSSPRPV